jgi:hypothetical protein
MKSEIIKALELIIQDHFVEDDLEPIRNKLHLTHKLGQMRSDLDKARQLLVLELDRNQEKSEPATRARTIALTRIKVIDDLIVLITIEQALRSKQYVLDTRQNEIQEWDKWLNS